MSQAEASTKAARKKGPWWRSFDLLTGLVLLAALLAVGLGLLWVVFSGGSGGPARSGDGIFLLVVGVPTVVVGLTDWLFPAPAKGRALRLLSGASGAVVAWVSIAVFLAGLAGVGVRWIDPADYYGRFGTPVGVTPPDTCERGSKTYTRFAVFAGPDFYCNPSHWTLNGVSYTGTAVLSRDDPLPGENYKPPETIPAFAIGDRAYSVRRVGAVENVAYWGGMPLWWVPVGLGGIALALFLGHRARPRPD